MIKKTIKYFVVLLLLNHNISHAQTQDSILVRVNDYWNSKIKYTPEKNKEDKWKTPIEITKDLYGDCEEFAIAKYLSLIAHGVSEDKLSLMWVILDNVETSIASHVVLIYKSDNGVKYVLDNYSKQIVPLNSRKDFRIKVAEMNLNGVNQFIGNKNFKIEEKWNSVLEKIEDNLLYLKTKAF